MGDIFNFVDLRRSACAWLTTTRTSINSAIVANDRNHEPP